MNREKQIEDMAKDLIQSFCVDFDTEAKRHEINFMAQAEALYKAGCRKQNEGEWKKRTFIIFDSEKVGYSCSECNTTWDTPTPYCPNCGSKMKGGAE